MQRVVHNADALEWLPAQGKLAGASVITSLPDVSEVPTLGFDGWRRWFVEAAAAVMRFVDDGLTVFFQSDIRHGGAWVDKGALVARAAEQEKMSLLFHKIVCRLPPGTPTNGRASYAHLLGFAHTARPVRRGGPDVMPDGGFKPGPKAMGVHACVEACQLVRSAAGSHTIVDPFCGLGTVLAVANSLGFDAIGVDLSLRMCRRARNLSMSDLQQ